MTNRVEENAAMQVKYGLPRKVKFCCRCVISNQRPNSTNEHRYKIETKKESTFIGDDGICDACRYAEMKKSAIDWEVRGKLLEELCNRHRRSDGGYDCIVPGSGGKDSRFVSHMLKVKYGMNPLTVTWPPTIYTDIGRRNFQSWLRFHDNITMTPTQETHRLLTRLAFENLLHPFQPFIVGQRTIAPRLATKLKIPLVFYGEPQAEYGNNLNEAVSSGGQMPKQYYASEDTIDNIYLGGVSVARLISDYNVDRRDLQLYMPVSQCDLEETKVEYHYFGHYVKWDPQEVYYYAFEQTGFEVNPERSEGTYSKYASLDDKIDGFHYYTTYVKFGIGRATYDAAQEVRNGKISRDEAIALVRRYDGEFPAKYFHEVLEYMGIREDQFWKLINAGRSPHLWRQEGNEWKLRHTVWAPEN